MRDENRPVRIKLFSLLNTILILISCKRLSEYFHIMVKLMSTEQKKGHVISRNSAVSAV